MSFDIVVIGSLNMDLVVHAKRAPKAGETLSGEAFQTVPGGKGANQALAAAKAGGKVAMIGRVGRDDFGKELSAGLAVAEVDCGHVRIDANASTGVALIVVNEAGENRIIVVAGANGTVSKEEITEAADLISHARLLILQLEIPLETVAYTLELAYEAGIPTLLNAAPAYPLSDNLLAKVTYLVVNESEAEVLSGCKVVDAGTAREAAGILRKRGSAVVVITLGSCGVYLAAETEKIHIPSWQVKVVDTTAAGDSFIGAFAAALIEGKSVVEAARFGNVAGALAVTKSGAQSAIPGRHEIEIYSSTHIQ